MTQLSDWLWYWQFFSAQVLSRSHGIHVFSVGRVFSYLLVLPTFSFFLWQHTHLFCYFDLLCLNVTPFICKLVHIYCFQSSVCQNWVLVLCKVDTAPGQDPEETWISCTDSTSTNTPVGKRSGSDSSSGFKLPRTWPFHLLAVTSWVTFPHLLVSLALGQLNSHVLPDGIVMRLCNYWLLV